MPITVFKLWEKFRGRVNTQQGGHVQPERNFLEWVIDVSHSIFETTFAGSWEKSQKITDDMAKPFLKTANIQVKNGMVNYPEDYGHFSSARLIVRKKDGKIGFLADAPLLDECGKKIKEQEVRPAFIDEEVWRIIQEQKTSSEDIKNIDEVPEDEFGEITIDKVDNSRWGSLTQHRFSRPTVSKPKITQAKGGWKIAPTSVKVIVLDYLSKPVDPTFVYTSQKGDSITGEGDIVIYDEKNSKPLEWDELMTNQFLTQLEKKYGKFIREDFIWNTSESDRKSTI